MSQFQKEYTTADFRKDLGNALHIGGMVHTVRVTGHGKTVAAVVSPGAGDMIDYLHGDQARQEGFAAHIRQQKPDVLEAMLANMDVARFEIARALHGQSANLSQVDKLAARTSGVISRGA